MFKTYTRILGFARPISRYAIPYFIYSLLYALFNTCTYVAAIPVLQSMFDPNFAWQPVEKFPAFAMNAEFMTQAICYIYSLIFDDFEHMRMLSMLAVLVIIINFLSNFFRYMGSWTIENMRTRTLQRIRNDLFSHVIGMNVGFFSEQKKGDVMSRITNDVMMVQFCITNTLQVLAREPFLVIGYIIAMINISWELSVFAVLFLPIVALIVGSIVKRLRHPALKGQERMGEMVATLDESLSGVKLIKSYNATEYIRHKFYAINAEFSRLMLSMARRQQLASPMSEFLGISAVGVVLVFGGLLVMRGSLNAASFIIFIGMFSQITRPVRSIIDQFATINQGIAAGERVFNLLDTQSEVNDKPSARHFEGLKKEIELKNIHFTYDGEKQVLSNISLKIKKGETVALVGPSGGGKSTLSELLPRFYDPQQGEVLLDGIDLREYTQESIRDHMSVVAQDTILFNDTIAANIGMGRPGATPEEIIEAAKIANAHDFIMECPEGYETNIGDRGMKLSGGQRQRLSIARAVLKNPEILILDEATSALDTESEMLVQEALNNLLKGRTSVVIAHRLSTIHNADKIFVIDQGRIAEEGSHTELMEQGGIYKHLIEMQSLE
uniref:ABC transporter ATP-binding protein n=1 Tax=Alistipes sp. TaxID=1872444 RepID=UPI0040568DC4